MNINIIGGGWVTASNFGQLQDGNMPTPSQGQPLVPPAKDIFSQPLTRYGRFDTYTKLGCAAIALAIRDAQLDQEIEKLNNHIEQQRILRPVFDSLLDRVKKENPTELPETKKVELERGEINEVSELLQDIAGHRDLKIQDIRTDVNDIMNSTGYMLMRIHATGDFIKFRDFLVDLGTIPSLEQIEEIKIGAIQGNREYKLRIWMALK